MNDAEIDAGLAPTPGYRYADMVGDRLFVAGQVPLDGSGELVGSDDPTTQASACLENLLAVVSIHGFEVDDLRQLVVYVVGGHSNLVEAWGSVRGWFGGEVPPATLLGVNLLGHPGQLVEIDATVVRSPDGELESPGGRS